MKLCREERRIIKRQGWRYGNEAEAEKLSERVGTQAIGEPCRK